MKKTFLFIALMAGVVSFSQAQPGQRRSPEEMAKTSVEQLDKRLSLTADQKEKVHALVLSHAKSRDSIFRSGLNNNDREAMRTKMRSMQQQQHDQILTLLNDEQKKSYQKWIEERQSRMRDGQRGQRRQTN